MTRMVSPELQLIELLNKSDEPDGADRARVRQKIALELAAGATAATTLFAAQKGHWLVGTGKVMAWLKAATVVASLSALGAGAVFYSHAAHKTDEVRTVRLAPKVAEADALVTTSPSQPAPLVATGNQVSQSAENPQAVKPSLVARTAVRPGSGDLEAELKLISQAQKALTSGQPNEALRALDEHQRRFPAGALSFERVGVRTVALCQAGRLSEGRAAARSYLRKVPNSVLSKRIRVACQLSDE